MWTPGPLGLEELRAAWPGQHPERSFEDWTIFILQKLGYGAALRWAPTFCVVCHSLQGDWPPEQQRAFNGGTCGHRSVVLVAPGGMVALLPGERYRLLELLAAGE